VSDTQARLDAIREALDLGLQAWRSTKSGPKFLAASDSLNALAAELERVSESEKAADYLRDTAMEESARLRAELERVTAALRGLREATSDYHQGCECGGSGVITPCPGRDTEGWCGACEVTACECCADLLVALYQANTALAGAAREEDS
jgi:hypothetical protein